VALISGMFINEHSTDEGGSPETSEHCYDFGTFHNILNSSFDLLELTLGFLV